MKITEGEKTSTITTENGSYVVENLLLVELQKAAGEPMKVTEFVKQATQNTGISASRIRNIIQQLAQPGQYMGSACIGALYTEKPEGEKSLYMQFNKTGPTRAKLTKKDTPLAAERKKKEAPKQKVTKKEIPQEEKVKKIHVGR